MNIVSVATDICTYTAYASPEFCRQVEDQVVWEDAFAVGKTIGESLEVGDFAGYDVIFIGSPLHSANLAAPVKEFVTNIQAGSGQKMAGFITHMVPAYPEQDMEAFADPIKAVCNEKGLKYMGCFDCQGFLAEVMHAPVQKKLNMSDEDWAGMVEQMTGHPNAEDVANAKAFAREVLS